MPTEAPATASASAIISQRCPRCGIMNKSGRLSCCARGGAWFQKCGDAGGLDFDHTWGEGIQACKCTCANVCVRAECLVVGMASWFANVSPVLRAVPVHVSTCIVISEVTVNIGSLCHAAASPTAIATVPTAVITPMTAAGINA